MILNPVTCLPSITQPFQGSDNALTADFSSTVPIGNGKAKDGWLLGHRTNKAGSGRREQSSSRKQSTSALLLAHSGRLALMAVCELAGLGWCSVSDANPAHPCCHCHHVTISQNSCRHDCSPWWQCSQSISNHCDIIPLWRSLSAS